MAAQVLHTLAVTSPGHVAPLPSLTLGHHNPESHIHYSFAFPFCYFISSVCSSKQNNNNNLFGFSCFDFIVASTTEELHFFLVNIKCKPLYFSYRCTSEVRYKNIKWMLCLIRSLSQLVAILGLEPRHVYQELNFLLSLIYINFNLNSHMWLTVTILDSTTLFYIARAHPNCGHVAIHQGLVNFFLKT